MVAILVFLSLFFSLLAKYLSLYLINSTLIQKNMSKILPFLFLLLCYQISSAQVTFIDRADKIDSYESFTGAPVGVCDVNGDRVDDIIVLDGGNRLVVHYQTSQNVFNTIEYGSIIGYAWGMTIGDLDNDGWSDIFVGGAYDSIEKLSLDQNGGKLSAVLDGPSIFVQAVSYADINNDGFLDAIACHDDGPNSVYINDGNGNLNWNNSIFNLSLYNGGDEQNSGNYGNCWVDIDSDGDLDYYIAKCRQGSNDPTDVRRINQLWINDGNGNFTESAESFGLDIGWQSWTGEFQDIDNDGDFDAFITNHDDPSNGGMLLENINNTTFVDITPSSGILVNGLPVQATMKDFDNDGFVDLLVTGSNGQLFYNNGDKTFTEFEQGFEKMNSFAVGDLNNDGFEDIFAAYGTGFNGSGTTADRVYINQKNDNNFFAVNLEGVQSNHDGIGARIEAYGDWGVMVREVRAGESYGITHSGRQNFGLGSSTKVETLIIKWPSGIVETYTDLDANQSITVVEDVCITPPSNITFDGPTTFCSGEQVTMTAPAGYTYLWNTGESTQSITANTAGFYSVQVSDGSSCESSSVSIEVIVDPEENFVIVNDEDLTFCQGSSISLSSDFAGAITWSNGATGNQVDITEGGFVSAVAQGTCVEVNSNTIEVFMLDAPEVPVADDVTLTEIESTTLTCTGENPSWFDAPINGNLLTIGNTYTTEVLEEDASFYIFDYLEYLNPPISVGELAHSGTSAYNGDNFNQATIFEVFQPCVFKSVNVETDFEGIREIQLTDAEGVVLDSLALMVGSGITTVELNWQLDEGSYQLTTNPLVNVETSNVNSPRLKRTSTDFNATLAYPYIIENLIEITSSDAGTDFYYYFYDWKIEGPSTICASEAGTVNVTLDLVSDVAQIDKVNHISIFPNPTSGLTKIEIDNEDNYTVNVKSVDGRIMQSAVNVSVSHTLDLSNYTSGLYIIELQNEKESLIGKLIVE